MNEILEKAKKLIQMYESRLLGGGTMPEDSNPHLDLASEENAVYLTLPMALNFQRNSYAFWESALSTFNDAQTHDVFNTKAVAKMDVDRLREKLKKYKLALQQNKHTEIWQRLCFTFEKNSGIVNFFKSEDFDVVKIKSFINQNKKDFPYLSGTKILNYWLFVMTKYTSFTFKNIQEITIAPDTHVIQSSLKLGVISSDELGLGNLREIVSERWKNILNGSGILPIDLHTPLWFWSREGFKIEI